MTGLFLLPAPGRAANPDECSDATIHQVGEGLSNTTIQGALNAMSHNLTGKVCVVVMDAGPYTENVTVSGFTPNGHRLIITADTSIYPHPVVSTGAVAAFTISNDSVTIQGLDISVTGDTYGVNVAGNYNTIARSSVTSDSSNKASLHFSAASSNTVTDVHVNNSGGTCIDFAAGSNSNTVSHSTMTGGGDYWYSVAYVNASSGNKFYNDNFSIGVGIGLQLADQSNYTEVRQSTMVNNSSAYWALELRGASYTTVEESYFENSGGAAARIFFSGGDSYYTRISSSVIKGVDYGLHIEQGYYTTVDQSSITAAVAIKGAYGMGAAINRSTLAATGSYAVDASGLGGVVLDGDIISNTAGGGIYLASPSTVTFSTVTSASSSGYAAYYVTGEHVVRRSYLSNLTGSGAGFVGGSGAVLISSSVIAANTASGSGVNLAGSYDAEIAYSEISNPAGTAISNGGLSFSFTYSTASGGGSGKGIYCSSYLNSLTLASSTINGGPVALALHTNVPAAALLENLAFREVAPGGTAIYYPETYPSSSRTLDRMAFISTNIATNVHSAIMSASVNLNMTRPTGPRSGAFYENDVNGRVTWPALPAGCYFGFKVAQDGSQSYSSIQDAVSGLGASVSTAACVAVADGAAYGEQVTVNGLDTKGFRLEISGNSAGERAILAPPASSTAAFQVMNASVTVAGFRIAPAGAATYGVLASSPFVTLSDLELDSSGLVATAGIRLSSGSRVENSSVTMNGGYGLLLQGDQNTVYQSTFTGSPAAALWVNGSGSTVTASYFYSPASTVAFFNTGAFHNRVEQSVLRGNSAAPAVYFTAASTNTISDSYVFNSGTCLSFNNYSNKNYVYQSTVSNTASGNAAVYVYTASSNTLASSYVRGQLANAIRLEAGAKFNAVIQSSVACSGSAPAILVYGSSNSINASEIKNLNYVGVLLNAGGNYNEIRQSTITAQVTNFGALEVTSSFNTVEGSILSNLSSAGYGARLQYGANYNDIIGSSISAVGVGRTGLDIAGDGNEISGSYVSNTSGDSLVFGPGTSLNAVRTSTVTSNSSSYRALFFNGSSSNTVQDSYLGGYLIAADIKGSTGAVIGGSRLASAAPGGTGLVVEDGSLNVKLTTCAVSAGATGTGIMLLGTNSGQLAFSSNSVTGGKIGMQLSPGSAGAALAVSSLTFSDLTAGATAINFLGGTYVSTFKYVSFNGTGIAFNVNADALDTGSRITMLRASGDRGGPDYENDHLNYVDWGPAALLAGPADKAAGLPQSPGLYAGTREADAPVQYGYEVDTVESMASPLSFDMTQSAVLAAANGAVFSGQDATISVSSDAYLQSSTATLVFFSTGTSRLDPDTTYFWRARVKEAEGYYGAWTTTASFTTGKAASQSPVNHIGLTGVNLHDPTTGGMVNIGFTIEENNVVSSQTPNGALYNTADWVFVKFSTQAGAAGTWNHATLTGGAVGAGAALTAASDQKGVFLNHTQSAAYWTAGATVTWNFATDGVLPSHTALVKVFAISMVKVPQGSFVYNAGGIGTSGLNNYNTGNQAVITGRGPVTGTGTGTDNLPAGALAGWPNGYSSFYMMRYEITQGLYADFLNDIHPSTAAARFESAAGYGHSMSFDGDSYVAADPFAAKNYLSTTDAWSFLGWAALRPPTEMEFEKAGRDLSSDMRTYPWGSAAPDGLLYDLRNEGGAHARNFMNYNAGASSQKVLDSGRYMSGDLFRTAAQTGASPYGIADLAGNVYEHVINCSFTAVPPNGNGTVVWPDWPVPDSTQSALRGGSWYDAADKGRLSDRYRASWSSGNVRSTFAGGRGCRTN